MQKPSIGRIVHYVTKNGGIRPAIITRVWTDTCVNLTVFFDASDFKRDGSIYGLPSDGSLDTMKESVGYAEPQDGVVEFQVNTWFWPPRV